ncbi:hypothetical protein Poli38472_003349 [Pythium oligandrum]|uniref:Uncharacterized protein n=1 Tax=Pythium oligandrum TaxID=41045 RepID=A0A8K1C6M4_PYTOL|nr:hypothetical protein Poli38472_003349 [Pythium oligandrum]|eukprot:TMW57424.1 hypothetical protein Poli38472_003349 [Pythium oligandrum]
MGSVGTDRMELQQLMRTSSRKPEHLLFCFSGFDARWTNPDVLNDVLELTERIIRIKHQMNPKHKIELSYINLNTLETPVAVTTDPSETRAALDTIKTNLLSLRLESRLRLPAIVPQVVQYFRQNSSSDVFTPRVVLIHVHSNQLEIEPFPEEVEGNAGELLSLAVDCVFLRGQQLNEQAQLAFDNFCSLDFFTSVVSPYFLDVSDSKERLHQAFSLLLSHPAHRLPQEKVETRLASSG